MHTFLYSYWRRACQLIQNSEKKLKLSAKSWNNNYYMHIIYNLKHTQNFLMQFGIKEQV